MIRFTKKSLDTWQFGKIVVFVNFSIPKLKFRKNAQLFIPTVSLVRGFFKETRENIFHIFRAIDPSELLSLAFV